MESKGELLQIRHYLDGRMSPGEMHDFEKRVLDDPFLADALDGYGALPANPAHQLSILQQRLADRVTRVAEDKNRFYFSWQRLSVAAVAGILFLLACLLLWMRIQLNAE